MSADVDAVMDALGNMALQDMRRCIEEEASSIAPNRRLVASLKWGQPSFALSPKHGTAVRLGLHRDRPAVFVHCGTSLVEDWRQRMGPDADVSGNRAVFIDPDDVEALRPFIRAALTYRS